MTNLPSTLEMFRVSCFFYTFMLLKKQITDHILTLQHSLVYYERMLSEWSSTYVSQLRAEISISKNRADVNLLYLTTVAVCCQACLIVIGRLITLYTNPAGVESFPQVYSLWTSTSHTISMQQDIPFFGSLLWSASPSPSSFQRFFLSGIGGSSQSDHDLWTRIKTLFS
jgi:hypothetical protein